MSRMHFSNLLILSFVCFFCALTSPDLALAHADHDEALWEMTDAELSAVNAKIEKQIQVFNFELKQALESESSLPSEGREFFFESPSGAVAIQRTLVTRVLIAAANLEVLKMERDLFCGEKCSTSLTKNMVDKSAMGPLRRTWKWVAAKFIEQVHPLTSRVTHRQSYLRYLQAQIAYKSQSYGRISMIAGAAGGGIALVTTEAIESAVLAVATAHMGGVGAVMHFACKANYFWSMAFGTAIASIARDAKAAYTFQSMSRNWIQRTSQLHTALKQRRLLKSLKSKTVVLEAQKIIPLFTHKQAIIRTPEAYLQAPSLRSLALADELLWSELLETKQNANEVAEHLSIHEQFKKLLDSSRPLLIWQDALSPLQLLLSATKVRKDAIHVQERNQLQALKSLGRIDLALRKLDLFMTMWLQKPTDSSVRAREAKWLSETYTEILSLILTINREGVDRENQLDLNSRIFAVTEIIDRSNREGSPSLKVVDGETSLKEILSRDSFAKQSCKALF